MKRLRSKKVGYRIGFLRICVSVGYSVHCMCVCGWYYLPLERFDVDVAVRGGVPSRRLACARHPAPPSGARVQTFRHAVDVPRTVRL